MAIECTARALRQAEQPLLRSPGQWSELLCVVAPANAVYTATLNLTQLPASNAGVASVRFTGGAWQGSYTRVEAGMTVWIGSTPGALDLGYVRLRSATLTHPAGWLLIGETSDVAWITTPQAARYITIVDEFLIWPRHLRTVGPYDTPTLAGKVTTNGDTHLLGFISTFGVGIVTMTFGSTALVGVHDTVNPRTQFLTFFAVGDLICIYNGPLGVVTRVITAIADDEHLTVDQPFTSGYTQTYGKATTRFLSEVRPGDNVVIDTYGFTREVVQVINDGDLIVSSAWAGAQFQFTFHVNRIDTLMDYDEPLYPGATNAHYLTPTPPVIVLGPPRVIDHFDGNPRVLDLNAAGSYALDGSVTSFAWRATGGTLANATTATPTMTVTASGALRVTCEGRRAAGVDYAGYGHRTIYVIGDNLQPLRAQVTNLRGDVASGGWSATVTVEGDITRAQLRDRAPVVIYARDHYGATETSLGQIDQASNIELSGYIVGETLTIDAEDSRAEFQVQGPKFWLDAITGVPTAFEYVGYAPGMWTQMYHLSLDRALWHFLIWRTTIATVTDVHLTGDPRLIQLVEGKAGTLWSQVTQMCQLTILARAACDRLGRLIIELDPQLIPAAARTTPVVRYLEACDWTSAIVLPRQTVNVCARETVSGVAFDGTDATPIIGSDPAGIFGTHGQPGAVRNLALVTQANTDLLARLLRARQNNPAPSIVIKLSGNDRLIDIAPAMYVTLDLPAGSNSRGLDLSQFPVLPRRVTRVYDAGTGTLLTEIEAEGYTDENTRVDGPAPQRSFVWGN